jgi:acyl-CoA synthetase (AMP-forming)/AMP-acid ligase II
LIQEIPSNFASRLIARLSPASNLIDAATGSTIGSEELPRRVAAFGAAFSSLGLQAGDRVLIGCALSPASALAYLGAIYAGFVAVPIDERTLSTSAPDLADACGARVIWSESALRSEIAHQLQIPCLHGDLGSKEPIEPVARQATDLAALMATSGSTGVPRFVKVSHGNLQANTEAIIRSQQLAHDERAMLILPISYCFGASVLHTHLFQGGSVVFDRRFMFPDKVLGAVAQFNCTTFAGVPTVYNILLRRSSIRQNAFPTMRRFLQAGGGLTRDKVSEMRAMFPQIKFYVMYGQTEATARIACMDPDRWLEKEGSVGLPLDNLTVSVVDEGGNPVEANQIGRLFVKGPSICLGYFNDADESHRVFKDDWLNTGDLARRDTDGFLWIEGRAGSFLKIRGTRVSIAEVEAKVASIPGVYECGACAVAHPEAGEALALFVVPDPQASQLTKQIRHQLPAHWTLHSIRMIPELPKTPAGKIARATLTEMSKEQHGTAE